jgi:hypothetical protein
MRNPFAKFGDHRSWHGRVTAWSLACGLLALAGVAMAGENAAAERLAASQQMMQQQMRLMQPPLAKRVQGLSPETKKMLLHVYSAHSRHSDSITLRQVMHEVLADYNSMNAGILTDNVEQAADSARRLADHRIPRGGLLPYLRLEDVTDEKLAALAGFNDSVEGNARRVAEAVEQGQMGRAAALVGDITAGCVGCHQVFRGVPGVSSLLK